MEGNIDRRYNTNNEESCHEFLVLPHPFFSPNTNPILISHPHDTLLYNLYIPHP